jgi:hypothetical protein
VQPDGKARAADLFQHLFEAVEARLRRQLGLFAVVASAARSRRAKPASQPIANSTGMKTSSPEAWSGLL